MKRAALRIYLLLLVITGVSFTALADTDPNLKLWFSFNNYTTGSETITDVSGNNFQATLKDGARIIEIGGIDGVLDLGSTNGYLDLGAMFGSNLISTLQDFTISTFVCISKDAVITGNGNFVFSFGNSDKIATDKNGCMFLSTKNTRYAISKTDWSGENGVEVGSAMEKGKWKHVAVTYNSTSKTAILYLNGSEVAKSVTINIAPKMLGATAYNFIGKSSYALNGDAYLSKTLIDEFRVYDIPLTAARVAELSSTLPQLNTAWNQILIENFFTALNFPEGQSINSNLTLPTTADGISVTWNSSVPGTISNTGVVVRPAIGAEPQVVTLTAKAVKDGTNVVKTFTVTVIPAFSDADAVKYDSENLVLAGNLQNLRSSLLLPSAGFEGSKITWTSDSPGLVANDGKLVYLPENGSGPTKVMLTATISKGSATQTRQFEILVAEKEGMSAYLFAYFTGNAQSDEAVRFAISTNGYTYKALNNNKPVLDSKVISSTGGIRDPHILRGADGKSFYMVATDMVSALGWNSNRAMVLMKSTNLTDWQTKVVNIQTAFSGYATLQRVWAPQTIYDPGNGKYMIYWSMKIGNDPDKIYYAYANSDFTALESAPKLLFENPDGGACIDGDIVNKDGMYHLFFKTEGAGNGIKKAVSANLTGGYVITGGYLQSTTNPVEGGCVFRMYDTDTWLLIYDMYMNNAYQFTKSTDLTHFSVVTNPVSFDFMPRHGTIIPITADEAAALQLKWLNTGLNVVPSIKTDDPKVKVISKEYYQADGKQVKKNDLTNSLIYIERTLYDNGSARSRKLFVNK